MNLIISRLLPFEDVPQKSSARFASLLPVCHNGVIAFTDRQSGDVEAAQKSSALRVVHLTIWFTGVQKDLLQTATTDSCSRWKR